MSRGARPPEPPTLFDLPLAAGEPLEPRRRVAPGSSPEPIPQPGLVFEPPVASWEDESLPDLEAEMDEEEADEPVAIERPAFLGERLRAGLADLALHVTVGLLALLGADLLGARPDLEDLPAVGLFLLAFSLFYTTVPLAFWGASPGMAWVGLVCRDPGGETLTFSQTVRHWLGSLLTLAFAGLPLLLGWGGRAAFSDRLAGSLTFRQLN